MSDFSTSARTYISELVSLLFLLVGQPVHFLSFSWIFWQMQPKVPIESAFQVTAVKVLPNVLLLYDKDYQLPCWLPQPLSHCCTFWFWWHKHPTSGTNFFISEDRLHFDIVTNELWNTSGLTWRRLISCLNRFWCCDFPEQLSSRNGSAVQSASIFWSTMSTCSLHSCYGRRKDNGGSCISSSML